MEEKDIIRIVEQYLEEKAPKVIVNVNYYDNRVERDDSTFVESAYIPEERDISASV